MSILLDALKKSEAQRQLGQAPDIYSAHGAEGSAGGRGRKWLSWALLIAAIIVAAWMGWRHLGPSETPSGEMRDAGQVAMPDAAAAEPGATGLQQPIPTTQDAPDEQGLRGPRTPVENFSAEEASGRDSAVLTEEDAPGVARKAQVNESLAQFDAAQENREKPPPVQAEIRPAKPADEPAAQKKAPGAAKADPQAPGTQPISFWELPQDVRDSLPDLHITVLVYAEEPAERFVLIGGKRLIEKEQVEQGVVLDEIRREGAVFRYRNYLFLVKS